MQQYSAKECEAWISSEWSEWTCTNCQTIGWSGQKKCRHCRVKKSFASALSTHRAHSGSGWTQAKPSQAAHHRSPGSHNKSRRSCSLFVETIKHTRISISGSAEVTIQIKHVERAFSILDTDVPAPEASRKILGTTDHRAEDTAESLTTPQQETGGCERRLTAEEPRAAFMLAQSVKGQAHQEAAKKTVRAMRTRARSPQCNHSGLKHTPTAQTS